MTMEMVNVEPQDQPYQDEAVSLHLSKVRGTNLQIRARLKGLGITNSRQLLAAAGEQKKRAALIGETGIEAATLAYITKRADLARVKGIGATFADMLEVIGVDTVERLASWDPAALHRTLHDFNQSERFARRAPTPEEIQSWIGQARKLPVVVEGI